MEQPRQRPAVRREVDTFKGEREGSTAGTEAAWRGMAVNSQGGS